MPPKIALLSYTVLFLMHFYCFAFCFMLFLCFVSGILYFNCFFKASLCVVKGALTNKIYHYYYFLWLFLFLGCACEVSTIPHSFLEHFEYAKGTLAHFKV